MIRRLVAHRALKILCVAAACLGVAPAWAMQPGEYQIKAAYLLNFARYVEWPAQRLPAGAPLRLCVLGRDPFGEALSALEGRQVNGHEVKPRVVDGVEMASDCHLVFITDSEERRVGLLLRGLAGRSVLTVSDIDGFAEAGGGIGLVVDERRVRFDINLTSVQREGLRASSQLLRHGRFVFGLRAP
ncbi:hypothetical protein GCM10007933_19420 [Zoogloea oryzae]|uniref:YfiR family protein n=1 Tax=Zoogloea oryzae TaxID=310767 RepID=A0ABQ6FCX0_9RHOO|nr:YfiR family protein [Zoogloea oryzae]GLT22482.1 hypothetical protein GCM10007933_19420 [Zoogloea oryzae]